MTAAHERRADYYLEPRYPVDEPPTYRARCACGWTGPERYRGITDHDWSDHMTEMSAAEARTVARFENAEPAPESWGGREHIAYMGDMGNPDECIEECPGCHWEGNRSCEALASGCDICDPDAVYAYAPENAEALRGVRELAEEWKGESVSAMNRADLARERNDRVLYTTNVRHARVIRQAATALLAALDGPSC